MDWYLNQTEINKDGVFDKETAVFVLGRSLEEPMKKILSETVDICLAGDQIFKRLVNGGRSSEKYSRSAGHNNGEKEEKQSCPVAILKKNICCHASTT